jgi:general secretion pathway protein E
MSLDRLLTLLEGAGVLDALQVDSVRQGASRRRRQLRSENEKAGNGDLKVGPVELVAAFNLPARGKGRVSAARIQQVVAEAAGLPYVDIDPLRVDAKLVTETLSHAYARRNAVLPLGYTNGRMKLAIADPFSADIRETMLSHIDAPVDLVVASPQAILQVLDEIFRFRASVRGAVEDLGAGTTDFGNLEQLVRLSSTGRNLDSDDRHVVHAVDFLLRYALDQSASDLHIEPKREKSRVRLRIDGVLHTVQEVPKLVHPAITSRLKTLARMDIAEKRRPQDGRLKLAHRDQEVELRLSTMPTAFGEKVVIRFFDPGVLLQDIERLGFFARELELFGDFIHRPTGLILVTGPTGSGKTTTLYSALRAVASPTVNVATVEDPIEMVVEEFNQTAVNKRLGLTFDAVLRNLLRQDPDVIMVGEIRDPETARNAIQAALTGHLVLATLHTNDAPTSVSRMIDLQVEPFLLASTLIGVVAQRLLRKVCLACRQETFLTAEQASALGLEVRDGEKFTVFKGRGCPACRNTGLKGRVGIFEVMAVDEKIRHMVTEGVTADEVGKQAQRDGMLTLRQAAIKKMALGLTSFEEVLRVTAEAGA